MTAKRLAILLIAVGVLAFTGCRSDREAARGELTREGLAYDADAFVERAREGDAESVKLFVTAGMSPDVKDKNGWTPLVRALAADRHDCAGVLLAAGAGIDARTDKGYTPLMAAAMSGDAEVVKTLLARGADVNAKDNNNFTPLMYAISRQRTEVIQTLLAAGAEPPPGFLQDKPEQKGSPS